jgi:hypothetical protein
MIKLECSNETVAKDFLKVRTRSPLGIGKFRDIRTRSDSEVVSLLPCVNLP